MREPDGRFHAAGWGGPGYRPVPADYDADGRADLAVYHAATGLWFLRPSSGDEAQVLGHGGPGFDPLGGD